ncbi:MAG: polymerase III, delta subunit protein [Parcubacteria group bacterium GW2011_GWA1_47_11]|nr:MAG: polymerase III, delta subunit protein [Parcubacteria group bacterium GW2011_GWA1_47_11]
MARWLVGSRAGLFIFLYGEDGYRLKEARDDIVEKYRAKHGSSFNFFRIEGADAAFADKLDEALKTSSLFGEVKLILVNQIFSNPEQSSRATELIIKHQTVKDPKNVLLAVSCDSGAKSKPLFNLLAKDSLVREYNFLKGPSLQKWIKKEAASRSAAFEPAALSRFASIGGRESWEIINNLEKLANYRSARGGPITAEDVNLLIKNEVEPNVFEFIEAVGSGQKERAFALLSSELLFGRDPHYLLSMLIYQFRNMLIVKDLADRGNSPELISKTAAIHPFVVRKMLPGVRRFALSDIKAAYQNIVELDQKSKDGLCDLEDSLFALALS